MFAVPDGPLTREVWMRYALVRIQELVDKPRAEMTDTELSIYTFATAALSGGQPIIPLGSPGLRAVDSSDRARLCRVCGAEWPLRGAAQHVAGCPIRTATA